MSCVQNLTLLVANAPRGAPSALGKQTSTACYKRGTSYDPTDEVFLRHAAVTSWEHLRTLKSSVADANPHTDLCSASESVACYQGQYLLADPSMVVVPLECRHYRPYGLLEAMWLRCAAHCKALAKGWTNHLPSAWPRVETGHRRLKKV